MQAGCPRLLLLLITFAASSGCQMFHAYRPVTVLVQDAETHQPIPDANVSIGYLAMLDPFVPRESSGKTGNDGIVELRAAPYHCPSILLDGSVTGYWPERKWMTAEDIRKIEPSSRSRKNRERPADFVLEMYSEPAATVDFVIPNGFRGLVKVKFSPSEKKDWTPGQRLFTYEVPPSGRVLVDGPRLLNSPDTGTEYRGRLADGIRLNSYPNWPSTSCPSKESATEVAFRWITCTGNYQFFAVGTQEDYDRCFRLIHRKNASGSWEFDYEAIEKER
jgi:hypothetical protein